MVAVRPRSFALERLMRRGQSMHSRLLERAAGRSVGVYPLSLHMMEPGRETDALVLGFTRAQRAAIEEGIRRLAEVLEEFPRRNRMADESNAPKCSGGSPERAPGSRTTAAGALPGARMAAEPRRKAPHAVVEAARTGSVQDVRATSAPLLRHLPS